MEQRHWAYMIDSYPNQVAELRKEKGWSKAFLANRATVSRGTILKCESASAEMPPDRRVIKNTVAEALATAFGLSVNDVFPNAPQAKEALQSDKYNPFQTWEDREDAIQRFLPEIDAILQELNSDNLREQMLYALFGGVDKAWEIGIPNNSSLDQYLMKRLQLRCEDCIRNAVKKAIQDFGQQLSRNSPSDLQQRHAHPEEFPFRVACTRKEYLDLRREIDAIKVVSRELKL